MCASPPARVEPPRVEPPAAPVAVVTPTPPPAVQAPPPPAFVPPPADEATKAKAKSLVDAMDRGEFPYDLRRDDANTPAFLYLAQTATEPVVVAGALSTIASRYSERKVEGRRLVDADYHAVVAYRLSSKDDTVLTAAFEAAGNSTEVTPPDAAVVAILLDHARAHPSAVGRLLALEALGKIAKPNGAVQAVFMTALDDESDPFVALVLDAMEHRADQFADVGALEAKLTARLSDPYPAIRGAAAACFGRLGMLDADKRESVGTQLMPLLDDPDPFVRGEAVYALGAMLRMDAAPKIVALLDDAREARIVIDGWTHLDGSADRRRLLAPTASSVQGTALMALSILSGQTDAKFEYLDDIVRDGKGGEDYTAAVAKAKTWYAANKAKLVPKRASGCPAARSGRPLSLSLKPDRARWNTSTMSRPHRLVVPLVVLSLAGCALFGGRSPSAPGGAQQMGQWGAQSRAAIAQNAPAQDEKLREQLAHHRESSQKIIDQHQKQAMTSNDVILGVAGFNGVEPTPLDEHVAFIRKHGLMPTPVPPEDRRKGKFFEKTSKANMDRMAAKYKDAKFMSQARVSLPTFDALGAYLLKELEGTTGVSWSTELAAMHYAAEIAAFEREFATKASDELMGELAAMMSLRDQARLQMATHTAMLATFEGVVNGGDPKAVMELAAASKQQIDERPEVSEKAAREFAETLSEQSLDLAASLESTMRAAHGDEVYDRHFRRELVSTLAKVEEAQDKASLYDLVDDAQKQARMQLIREKAQTVQQRLTERAKAFGLAKAEQFLGKLPFGSQIVSGIKALRELRNGNPRGALLAAIDAVPNGAIREGMKTATTLGFAAGKMIKNRRGA